MPVTRTQLETILKVYIKLTFQIEQADYLQSDAVNALNVMGVTNIDDFKDLDPDEFLYGNLQLEKPVDPNDPTQGKQLVNAKKMLCTKFKHSLLWCKLQFQNNNYNVPDPAHWTSLTYQQFTKFRMTPGLLTAVLQTPASTNPSSTPSAVDQFDRKLKLDVNVFPKLTRDDGWNTYNTSLIATAHTYGLNNVLDAGYTPPAADQALFIRHKLFMFTVFGLTVLTDKGKDLHRNHSRTQNAQQFFYQDLVRYYTRSAASNALRSTLHSWLTTTQLDAKWRGATTGFLIHWKQQLQRYHDTCTPTKMFPDSMQKILLKNAVSTVAELTAVKSYEDVHITAGNPPL